MADSQGITLYTSIPPTLKRMAGGVEYGDAYQKECIHSWIAGGFRVVSINPGAEIASLKIKHPQVKFVDSDSENARTRIDVFFQNIATTGERFSGIINADCYLLSVGANLDAVRANVPGTITLLRRLDIDQATLRPSGRKTWGFDGFLFDTKFLARIDGSNEWEIGEPWWDLWFPFAIYVAGARLRLLDVPVLLHLEHEQRWSWEGWEVNAGFFWDVLKSHSAELNDGRVSANPLEMRDPHELNKKLLLWLHLHAETIRLANECAAGNFLSKVLIGMEDTQEASLQHQLDTVTFPQWLQSKRGAVRRLHDRIQLKAKLLAATFERFSV